MSSLCIHTSHTHTYRWLLLQHTINRAIACGACSYGDRRSQTHADEWNVWRWCEYLEAWIECGRPQSRAASNFVSARRWRRSANVAHAAVNFKCEPCDVPSRSPILTSRWNTGYSPFTLTGQLKLLYHNHRDWWHLPSFRTSLHLYHHVTMPHTDVCSKHTHLFAKRKCTKCLLFH